MKDLGDHCHKVQPLFRRYANEQRAVGGDPVEEGRRGAQFCEVAAAASVTGVCRRIRPAETGKSVEQPVGTRAKATRAGCRVAGSAVD